MSVILSNELKQILNAGTIIPANPTALTKDLKLDERRQRALMRYYLDAGSGGLAIGVHTSQFEIREAGLFQPILELGKEELDAQFAKEKKPIIRVAGAMGKTEQAIGEATLAADLDYNAVLLNLSAFKEDSNEVLINHCKEIAAIIPVIGFYLQPTIGGRSYDTDFWRQFAQIENVVAIKVAAFDRYDTIDVIRGVAESGRADKVALYTGNDDTIVNDLLSEYQFPIGGTVVKKSFVGGLLGHWAVWNNKAVELFNRIKNAKPEEISDLISLGVKVTDANAAFFDSRNKFKGSIAGIHEVLIRQGFMEANYTISSHEVLSPGQKEEIDRVYKIYPELNDDEFVAENIDRWMR
ncbi:dihydrodipicolinate synthase family protein [Aurantibacter sp.]|uniref:dihydrodipicolinate synthase family protein n=1 Tax=Aurantibacter sp. TaxID=2807103 RepID=UPI003262F3CA